MSDRDRRTHGARAGWWVPRRRGWAGVAALAAAGVVAVAGCGDGGGGVVAAATAQPAVTTVSTVAPAPPKVIYGVRVGWLPAGYVVVADDFQDVTSPAPSNVHNGGSSYGSPEMLHYTEQWVRVAGAADVAAVRAADKPRLDGPSFTIDVERGQVPTVADAKAIASSAKLDESYEDTTVAGHPATLTRTNGPPVRWGLTWTRGKDTAVLVNGSDQAVVRRIAENLTVGPAPAGPADPVAAAAQVRAAARTGFQGSGGLGMLAAVDDPQGLARLAVTKYLSEDPTTAAKVRVDRIGDIVFLGPTEAGSQVTILYPDKPGLFGGVGVSVRFTLTAAGWKLTRESFCLGMYEEFPGCPTTT